MAIPDFQTLMLPVLSASASGEVRVSDVVEQMIQKFSISPDEAAKLLPSGKQAVISNRTQWAKSYLGKAGLIESTRRGYFKITDRGRATLAESPQRIDIAYLSRFEEFKKFREREVGEVEPGTSSLGLAGSVALDTVTPDELLRATVRQIEATLAKEVLDRILAAPPAFFESVVVSLLLAMGYGGSREEAGRAIGRSGDGGLDGVIDQDALGLDRVYIQAKRYAPDNGVSAPSVQAFAGALGAAKANKGVFVTTSYFTKAAIDFVARTPDPIILIDGQQLTSLMIRYNVGTRIEDTLYIKKIDEDFFAEE